jgi:hypothetical protein
MHAATFSPYIQQTSIILYDTPIRIRAVTVTVTIAPSGIAGAVVGRVIGDIHRNILDP